MTVIAREVFSAQRPSGERFDLIVEIGAPEPSKEHEHEWRCSLSLSPIHKSIRSMAGDGALQALCLSVRLAYQMLEDFVAKGGTLTHDDGSGVDLKAIFGIPK